MIYTIYHTESKYSIDGKDHFKVMVCKIPNNKLKSLGISKSWEQSTGIDHSTLEEAQKELKSTMRKNDKFIEWEEQ